MELLEKLHVAQDEKRSSSQLELLLSSAPVLHRFIGVYKPNPLIHLVNLPHS
jgi:hypothetical protein